MLSRNTKKNEIKIIKSGVYVLILGGIVVYVGESKNVYSRIGAHVKDSNKRFDSVRILPCQEHRRKYWEAVLIDRYQPLFNKTGKDKETNRRHIFELGKITKRQLQTASECANCRRDRAIAIGGNGVGVGYMAPSFHGGITTTSSTVGSLFIEKVPASDREYSKLAKQEASYREEPKPKTILIKVEHEIKALESKIQGLRGYEPEREKSLNARIIQLIKSRKKYVELTVGVYSSPTEDEAERLDICRNGNFSFSRSGIYNVSTSVTDPASLKKLNII